MKLNAILLLTACLSAPVLAAENTPAPRPAVKPAADEPKEEKTPAGTKAEQLAAAQKELVVIRLRHSEQHPVVLKQRTKVARLQKEVRDEERKKGPVDPAVQLAAAKKELETMLQRYTDQHPLVVAQRKRIAELEQARK